jgi:hypothetical protein
MQHTRKILVLLVILILIPTVFSTLMTSDEASDYFSDVYKANAAKSSACIKAYYAEHYDIQSEDEYYKLRINQINVAGLECSTNPCTQPCRTECCDAGNCTLDCISDCESACAKPDRDACDSRCAAYGSETQGRFQDFECQCVCAGSSRVIYNSKCLLNEDAETQGYDPTDESICRRDSDCGESKCTGGKCEGATQPPDEGCSSNYDCESGSSCVSNQCVANEGCSDNSDCPAMQECVNDECVTATGELTLTIDKTQVLLDTSKKVNITAKISGARSGTVKFEISDPDFIFSLGTITISKSISGSGVAQTTLSLPAINQIPEIKRQYFPYLMRIKASASIAGQNLSKSSSITLKSPAPEIKSVVITPTPVESYKVHTLVVKVEDPNSTTLTYNLHAVGEKLERNNTTDRKENLEVQTGKTLSVTLYGEESGFNMAEIEKAKEIGQTLSSGAISASASLTKAGVKAAAKKAAEKGAIKISDRLFRWVPIIGKGKTMYGLYQSEKSGLMIALSTAESANWKEAMYNTLNLGAEGIRFGVGTVDLFFGDVPILGKLTDLTQDLVDTGLGAGQTRLKSKALEARSLSAEKKSSYGFVDVTVTDEDGFSDNYMHHFNTTYYDVDAWYK